MMAFQARPALRSDPCGLGPPIIPRLLWHKTRRYQYGHCRRSIAMEQYSSPRGRRALIVEDEIVIALDLQDAMFTMGFDHCDLASSDRNARSLAMGVQHDVALV